MRASLARAFGKQSAPVADFFNNSGYVASRQCGAIVGCIEIAVDTLAFAEWDVDVDACELLHILIIALTAEVLTFGRQEHSRMRAASRRMRGRREEPVARQAFRR